MLPVSLVFQNVVTVKNGRKTQLEWDIHSIELDVYLACVLCNGELNIPSVTFIVNSWGQGVPIKSKHVMFIIKFK